MGNLPNGIKLSPLPILVILGDRTAQEVFEAAQQGLSGQFGTIEKIYFDPDKFSSEVVPRFAEQQVDIFFNAGMANDVLKRQVVEACRSKGWQPHSVIHPTAVIAPTATIQPGVFVGPLAVVSSQAMVEQYSIIHIHSSIGHDATVGEYSAILPGARISGHVKIGKRSMVGSNAFVAAGKTIGDDCRIDALSYVQQHVLDGHVLSPRYAKALKRVEMREASGE